MDVEQSIRQQKLAKLGCEWAETVEKEITEKIGPNLSGLEKCNFYATACAELGARIYDALMKDDRMVGADLPEGMPITEEIRKSAAEHILQTTFTLMSALIRQKGYEVQVTAKLSFTKLSNSRANEAPKEESKRIHETCSCQLDQDGNCDECRESAHHLFSGLVKSMAIMKEVTMSGQKFCRPCAKRHMDQVLAKIIRESFTGMDPEASESFMNSLMIASQSMGTMEMPLTKRAWDELQKGTGSA